MKIKFQGVHKTEEVIDSLAAVLRLFEQQYGVGTFNEIKLNLSLVNESGEEVELIDASTSEVFDVLEVHQSQNVTEDPIITEYSESPDGETIH